MGRGLLSSVEKGLLKRHNDRLALEGKPKLTQKTALQIPNLFGHLGEKEKSLYKTVCED